jgi:hypothetical protein
VSDPSSIGERVRVRGFLRNGVVQADEILFSRVPPGSGDDDSAKRATKRATRRAGWIELRGIVEPSREGRLTVNGFDVAVGRRGPVDDRLPAGTRVAVAARLGADGPLATRIRRP